jgi:hypothetical protein
MSVPKRRHNERCPQCKKNFEILLEKLFGGIERSYRFNVGTRPEDFDETPYRERINSIYETLRQHRGFREFVKAKSLPNGDFFVPNPGFIVEFDESQHFTELRRVALELYPESLRLGYDRRRWIMLCDQIHQKDNDPPYRDEQRAWYDTLRDFLPTMRNLSSTIRAPTVRLFARDLVWCNLNPNRPSDVKQFQSVIESNMK